MPSPEVAIRIALEQAIRREVGTMSAERRWETASNSINGNNPLSASGGVPMSQQFSTGYNSGAGTTSLLFTFDVSLFGGPDVLAA